MVGRASSDWPREHDRLLQLVRVLPQDYQPFGDDDRREPYGPDCSGGCRFARWLQPVGQERLDLDWCVCTNPRSHRCGLLTFEHQGCREFEADDPFAQES